MPCTSPARIQSASYVVNMMRIIRLYVKAHNDYTLDMHTFPRQTYQHILLSCQSVVLQMSFQRDFTPDVDFCGKVTGSDICESLFSTCTGSGEVAAGQRVLQWQM